MKSQPFHTPARQNGKFLWTDPYCGVTHCGEFGPGQCWITVTEFGTFSTLDKWDWRKDTLLAPDTQAFNSKAEAVAEAEKWMASCGY